MLSFLLDKIGMRVHHVVHSTLSAETSAMVDALDITYFLSNVLSEILFFESAK